MNKSTIPNIVVKPIARYEHKHSSPAHDKYVHSYHIIIENHSNTTVQLVSRHWFIVDGVGRMREVQGVGVIGKQPVINPGNVFEYDSWSPITTPIGRMYGTFTMLNLETQKIFDVEIPTFPLNATHIEN